MSTYTPPIYIVADDRERQSGVIESLSSFENVSVQIRRLSIGDYRVDRCLLVERKTLKDFSISIVDGRLFTQMIRIKKSNFMGALIIEGTARDLMGLGISRKAMQGALITVSLVMGISILRSTDTAESAALIVYMARQLWSASKGTVRRWGYRPKRNRTRQLHILQGLPGIGPEKAVRLLDKFGSVEAVISADCDALQSIDGIGKGIAQKIRQAVSKQ
jgi:ERCC4-type nuclease